MEFSPENPIVMHCMQGMGMQAKGESANALACFKQAWSSAGTDFEKYLAAFFIAGLQDQSDEKLRWYQTALHHARVDGSPGAVSAFHTLYSHIARCLLETDDNTLAAEFTALAAHCPSVPDDNGPFYHGTRADLPVGDLLTAGAMSNYQDSLVMNHIYFTGIARGAGLAAALARSDGRERVYIVEPTGDFENDPNVTDKKFPGNPTRSYRSTAPLRIVGELADWPRQHPDQINAWREKLSKSNGEIIN